MNAFGQLAFFPLIIFAVQFDSAYENGKSSSRVLMKMLIEQWVSKRAAKTIIFAYCFRC